ncbi:hypothetical protein [Nocardia sp. NPDC047038]|uniref:hypothetical protein n=1 Tax=Nocardia sp. NPDC047038 TaxID=3154338 RepID=UPI0033E52CB9
MSGWIGRVAVWAALGLMGLSSAASFLFGRELAELAGMPLYLGVAVVSAEFRADMA